MISSQDNIADFDKLWDYNKPEETEKKFRSILREVKELNDKSLYLQLLTQIARTQSLQMKFDEAHEILDEVKDMLSDDLKAAEIRYLLERGRTYNSSKQKDKARECFLKAYNKSVESKEDFYAVDAAHMMGIVEPHESSLEWNSKALALAEKSDDPRAKKWRGSLYNNMGWAYYDIGKLDKALDLFEKNVQWHTDENSPQKLSIAKWCVAKTLRSMNRVKEALELQNSLLKEMEENNLEQDGFVYEELGECHYVLGAKAEASEYFAVAYELLSKDIWLAENEKDRLERIRELSKANIKK